MSGPELVPPSKTVAAVKMAIAGMRMSLLLASARNHRSESFTATVFVCPSCCSAIADDGTGNKLGHAKGYFFVRWKRARSVGTV